MRPVLALLAIFLLALPRAAAAQDAYQEQMAKGLRQLEARDYDAAIASFKKCLEINADSSLAYYNLACAYSLAGAKPEALAWFRKSLEHGFADKAHIAQDTDLDPIRGEPEFAAAMAKFFPGPPPGKLFTLKGAPAALERALEGKVALLVIWRTWALPCRDAAPALGELARERAAEGLAVVAISDEPAADQEKAADELKIGYTLLRCDGALPGPLFEGARELFPTFIVVGRDGKVVKKLVGARSKQELEAVLLPLLAAKRQSF